MTPRPESVLGVDLSLVQTGLASAVWGEAGAEPVLTTAIVKPTLRGHARRQFIVRKIIAVAQGYDLVGLEGISYGSKGKGHAEVVGLWYELRSALWRADLPVAVISPGTRAKYATGKGGGPDAAKPRVLAATRGLWPALTLKTSDEADALLLAAIAARVAGRPFDAQPSLERFAPVNGITIGVES
jgi:Holliday junction resolvasome RuvABC endonuclease subunit